MPPSWKEVEALFPQARQDRLNRERAARVFVRVCAEGDADAFWTAAQIVNEASDGWSLALRRAARLPSVSPAIQEAFADLWVQAKTLPLRVGNRRVLASALRVFCPPVAKEGPVRLYRGASAWEWKRRRFGFCWTTEFGVAQKFARQRTVRDPAVILETLAPPEAVAMIPDPFEAEFEVVVDPFKLEAVTVHSLLPQSDGSYEAIQEALLMCGSHTRLGTMLELLAWVDDDLFWRVFNEFWTVCDDTWDYQDDLREAFADRGELWQPWLIKHMASEDRAFYDALPDRFTIYRGCSGERVRGMSWTTDRKVAEGFARGHRFVPRVDRVVASARVRKRDVIAVFQGRHESEVLIEPACLPKRITVKPFALEEIGANT